jgi:hypothetical protein
MPNKNAARAVAETTGGKARRKRKRIYPVREPPSQVTLDDLLGAAGVVVEDARVRADLELALYRARTESASEQAAKNRPSPKLLENLEKNITKTQLSLEKAEKYASTSNIGSQIIPLETGIVKALPVRILGKHKELPTIPADAMYVCIDINNLLRVWHDNVKKVPREPQAKQGNRNNWLWGQCMREARHCDTLDALMDVARTRNMECEPPMEDTEVMKTALSAWDMTQENRNHFAAHGAYVRFDETSRMIEHVDAPGLLIWLRTHEGPLSRFVVPNSLADRLGWTLRRLQAARNMLIEEGYLRQVRAAAAGIGGAPGRAALFQWND